MSNTLLPKRSNEAAKVPTTAQLVAHEIAVNTTDRKIYMHDGAAVVQIGAGQLSGLADVSLSPLLVGQTLAWNGSAWANASGGGAGPSTALVLPVTNASAATLTKGSPVYQSAVVAPYSYQVGAADANDLTRMPVLGLLSADIAAGDSGTVVVQGELQGLDTSAWALRDRLWISPSGALVNAIPTDSFAATQVLGLWAPTALPREAVEAHRDRRQCCGCLRGCCQSACTYQSGMVAPEVCPALGAWVATPISP